MSGKSTIIVGGTGTGKSTFLKDRIAMINRSALHLYDVNAEYKEYYPKPFINFKTFTIQAQKLCDAVIVFEEATIFLSNKGSNEQINDILVRKRHTNNMIFFVFHSLRAVPRWVYDLSNFVVLFRTNDSEGLVSSRFESDSFTACFNRVQQRSITEKHYYEFFKIY